MLRQATWRFAFTNEVAAAKEYLARQLGPKMFRWINANTVMTTTTSREVELWLSNHGGAKV